MECGMLWESSGNSSFKFINSLFGIKISYVDIDC